MGRLEAELLVSDFIQFADVVVPHNQEYHEQAVPLPPMFHGEDYDNPEEFLLKAENYFSDIQAEADNYVTIIYESCLKSFALAWFAPYVDLQLTWPYFCRIFLDRYASPRLMVGLMQNAVNQAQQHDEDVEGFVIRRNLLLGRLHPYIGDTMCVEIIKSLMTDQYKSYFENKQYDNFLYFLYELRNARGYIENAGGL